MPGEDDKHSLIHRAFEQEARRRPDHIAIKYADASLTYRQLNERANHLAAHMQRAGVARGAIVALMMSRCPGQIVAMLAILKCGAAYLPLDKNDPVSRNLHCLNDAEVGLIVADHGCDERLLGGRACMTTGDDGSFASECEAAPSPDAHAEDRCYAMFTSGSTGLPKGVVVPHRAVMRLVRNTNYIQIGHDDRILQFAPASFDASTFEIWGALLNGATLVLYSGATLDPNLFAREIRDNRVTILWLTAALFHLIATRYIGALKSLKILLAGGDVLYPKLVNKVLDDIPGITVINGYGPTENTTFTCCHRMTVDNRPGDCVPIGKAITGTALHILDAAMHPVADGEIGELFVSGPGIALGYLGGGNGAAFFTDARIAEGLIYRTGDMVKLNRNGDLEFEGRKDNQIKIRGFRVSLEEIQACVLKLGQVSDVAVLLDKNDAGDQQLIAYIQVCEHQTLTAADVRKALAAELPRYMIPDLIHLNADLPINKNGKIDRNRIKEALIAAM